RKYVEGRAKKCPALGPRPRSVPTPLSPFLTCSLGWPAIVRLPHTWWHFGSGSRYICSSSECPHQRGEEPAQSRAPAPYRHPLKLARSLLARFSPFAQEKSRWCAQRVLSIQFAQMLKSPQSYERVLTRERSRFRRTCEPRPNSRPFPS